MSEADIRAASTQRSIESAKGDAMDGEELHPRVEQLVASQVASVTSEEKEIFLAKLIEHGVVAKACQAIGISRMAAWRLRKRDPVFALQWSEILEAWVDNIEAVLLQQCLDPSPANTIARFFALKAHRAKYRDSVQAAQPTQAPKVHVIVELNRKPDSKLDAVDAEFEEVEQPSLSASADVPAR